MPRKSYVYTYRSVKRQGKKHGRDWRWKFWPPKWPFREAKEPNPPRQQTEYAQFEKTLTEAAESDIQLLADQWKKMDKKLKDEYCSAKAEREAAKIAFNKEAGEEQTASAEFEMASKALLNVPSPPLDPRWMRFWLFVIAIAELPLNAVVFQILGQGRAETYLVAAFIGVFFPLAAHAFGKALRQEIKTRTDNVLVALSPLFILSVLAVLGFVRAKFFEALGLQRLLGITITPTEATILFIVINVAVFFVAVVISYQGSHASEAEYNTLLKRYKEAVKRLGKESGEARAAAQRKEAAEARFQTAYHQREKTFERITEQAKLKKETNDWYVSVYRAANLNARRDAKQPDWFKLPPPEAQIPNSLTQLDRECLEKVRVEPDQRSEEQHAGEEPR